MLQNLIDLRLDAAALVLLLILAAILLHCRLRRAQARVPVWSWAGLVLLTLGGIFGAEWSGQSEVRHLQTMVQGFAPTYAQELTLLGHWQLPDDCAMEDPNYQRIAQAQQRWENANASIASIYTLRRRADGGTSFLVDSPTDYNKDGAIAGELEEATPVGEPFEYDPVLVEQAFGGQPTFASNPEVDPWGIWVTAYAPIHDPQGNIEAVLGVDYDANEWTKAIAGHRLAALGLSAMLAAMLIGSTAAISFTRAELDRRIAAERAAHLSEQRFRTIVDCEPECVLVVDPQGLLMDINPAGLNLIEAESREQLSGLSVSERIHPDFRPAYLRLHEQIMQGRQGKLEFALHSMKGSTRWVEMSATPLRDHDGRIYAKLSISRDITSRMRAEQEKERIQRQMVEELRLQATSDQLTGLPNRLYLCERLEQLIEHNYREPDFRYAVLFLDFDRFKVVNDSLGHQAGDQMLRMIATRLKQAVAREIDEQIDGRATVARLGGDEFVVLLEGLREDSAAAAMAERLLANLSQPYELNGGHQVQSTVSIGVMLGNPAYTLPEQVLRDADTAMYRAKATGKAKYVLFDRCMHEEAMTRLTMENQLRRALDNNELYLVYQPIVDLESGRVCGFEALARWRQADGRLVPPLEFVPLAEEIGIICTLGLWVLKQACLQLAMWQQQPEMAHMTVSVNLSRKQLAADDLVPQVKRILEQTGARAHGLKLEITESVMMDEPDLWAHVLSELRGLGIGLHMDDFGTGYSSLSCLHRFPIEGLKIDRAFINNVAERRDYAAVVNAIITLARNLDVRLIAEGVETVEQVSMLQALGCDSAQGFFFAPPMLGEAAQRYALAQRSMAA